MNDTSANNGDSSTRLSKRAVMTILVASVAICAIIMALVVSRCSRDESEETTTPPAEASWNEESDSELRDTPVSDSSNTGDEDADTNAREKTRGNLIATTLYISVIHGEDEDGTFAIELSGDCFNPNDVPVDISAMSPITINGTQATLMSKGTIEPAESSGYTYECTFEPKDRIEVTYGQHKSVSDIDVIREDAVAAIELNPRDTAQTIADSIATVVALSRSRDERVLSVMGEAPAEAEDIPAE